MKVFGRNPAGSRLPAISRSSQYKNGAFRNQHETPVMAADSSFFGTLGAWLNKPASIRPAAPLPVIRTDLGSLPGNEPVVTWFGHSSYLIRISGYTILVDPLFSGQASPFPFLVKSFDATYHYRAADMPPVDLLVLTHDHYDHLDYETILALSPKVKKTVTTLGTSAHLEYWGIAPGSITELDWEESCSPLPGIKLTAMPGRHFSGRGLTRGKTLWASFMLDAGTFKMFIGGDSGYDRHFADMGNRFGPFDLAVLECGQYNERWPYIHMMPEETIRAAVDLKARQLLPVHWGKFALSLHPWNEPPERLLAAAGGKPVEILLPKIGEPVYPWRHHVFIPWWNDSSKW